jgi:hypothetical protein
VSKIKKWLIHKNILVRAITLWILCSAFLTATWFVSYYFLPYGVLRGVFPSANLPLGNYFFSVFLTIFLYNLIVGCGFTVAANLVSVETVPLGYLYPFVQECLFGIFLGTDSFAISHGGRLFPSLSIVNGAGFYELTAYILVASATAKLTLWNQTGWLGGNLERIRKRKELKLARSETSTLILGVLLLLVAATIEAAGIMGT